MSDYFPHDILNQILLLLPQKSLVRFCCVSKSWKSHITSFDFIRAKLKTSGNINNLLLLKYDVIEPENVRYALHLDNDNLDLYENLNSPFHTNVKEYLRVLGSVNGLVCLETDLSGKMNHLGLWNPSIRKFLTLPRPPFTCDTHGRSYDAIGFGFDSRNNDYKVVRLFFEGSYPLVPVVQIFKLSTGSWETIAATIGEGYHFQSMGRTPVYLNGVVYWSVRSYKMNIKTTSLVSFDMINEVFNEILLPPWCALARELHVAAYGDCLSIIRYIIRGDRDPMLKEIWVMKEESWTKLLAFHIPEVMGMGRTVAFTKNGDFFRTNRNGQLFSYDARTDIYKGFDIFEHVRLQDYLIWPLFFVGAYEESLVLLGHEEISEKGNNLSKELEDEEHGRGCVVDKYDQG